jgi:ankyrin repeat protein
VDATSKQSYPGLNALLVAGLLGVIVGCFLIGLTVLRVNAHILPVVTEPGVYLTLSDISSVFNTWYGAGITLLCLGVLVATGAIVARVMTAGRFTANEAGRTWVGVVAPLGMAVFAAGTLALPLIVESQMRKQAHHYALVAQQARERSALAMDATNQRKLALAQKRATVIEGDIDAITSKDIVVRRSAILRLAASYELFQRDPEEPFATLRARLLTTLDNHWKEICTTEQLASDVGHLYSQLDAAKGAIFASQWQVVRMNYLDPQGQDMKMSLRADDDPEHLLFLKRYCDKLEKSAVATDPRILELFGQAVNQTSVQAVGLLLDEGIPADTLSEGANGTALTIACERGGTGASLEMLKLLLAHGANPNAQNSNDTVLMLMIKRGSLTAVNALLDAHADPNLMGQVGATPLFIAIENHKEAIVATLLKHGASTVTHASNGDPVIFTAVQCGNIPIIESLLQAKADPNELGNRQETALSAAVDGHKSAIVALLLKYGANPNQRAFRTSSLLARAIAQNDANMVKALLDAKADLNLKDAFGNTPLMSAIQNGSDAIIALLIADNAEINVTDSQGRTALLMAATADQIDTVRKLLIAHADPNIPRSRNVGFREQGPSDYFIAETIWSAYRGAEGSSLPSPPSPVRLRAVRMMP